MPSLLHGYLDTLGLIVARRLLQLNQGDIQYVETEAGTTFRFWLPAA